MSQIYFVRHAQASFGRENYDRLSDLGVRQSEILGDYFARRGLKFDAVYSGAMERQIHTAQTVMSRLPTRASNTELRIASEFNEYDSSSITESQWADLIHGDPSIPRDPKELFADPKAFQRIFERAVLRWISGRHDVQGIETWQAFTQRVHGGVKRIMGESGRGKTVAVFTSGGPISAVMKLALNLSDEKTIKLSWLVQNTAVSTFMYSDKEFSLSSFNSVAHLERLDDPDLLTYR